jgi:hypothetical protein
MCYPLISPVHAPHALVAQVIVACARLFMGDRKIDKARKVLCCRLIALVIVYRYLVQSGRNS